MQGMWSDIRNHRLASTLFLLYWLAVNFLYLFGPQNTQDSILQFQLLLAAIAGSLVCWWRRRSLRRITVGTLAGTVILLIGLVIMLARDFLVALVRGKGVLVALSASVDYETLVFASIAAVIGAVLGLLGALAIAALGRLLEWKRNSGAGSHSLSDPDGMSNAEAAGLAAPASSGRILPRPILLVACGLVLAVAAILAPNEFGRSKPPFVSTINVLVGVVLVVPVPRSSADAGNALLLLAGLVSLSLASLLLVGGGSRWTQGPNMAAIVPFVCSVLELGAGVLALAAAFCLRSAPYAA